MTPALRDILTGCIVALSAPQPPEAGADYAAGRATIVIGLLSLAGQEAERGAAAVAWENAALRDLFARAAPTYDAALGGKLARQAGEVDADFTLTALASANATLRRSLIELHEAAEARADLTLDRDILDLYRKIAAAHRLDLAGRG
jgi:hypothetical protein